MRLFEDRFAFFLTFICTILLFLPKINLFSLGERESAGLRIDDIILLLVGSLVFLASLFQRRCWEKAEFWLIAFIAFSIFSFLVNRLLVNLDFFAYPAYFLYCFRLFEYFVFFYVGSFAIRFFNIRSVITWLAIVNGSMILLQQMGLVGEFGPSGYTILPAGERSSGMAAFPSEMGTSLSLMFCFFLCDSELPRFIQRFSLSIQEGYKKIFPYVLCLLFGLLTVFTGSRISMLALTVVFVCRLCQQFSLRTPLILTIAVGAFVALSAFFYAIITNIDYITDRGSGLFSFTNLQLIYSVWEEIDINYSPIDNEIVEFQDFDLSWWLRIHKWMYVAKIFCFHPECWLQGVGPGFAFTALDGGLLRIFVEYGVIGSFLAWKFFSSIYRINSQLKWMMIALVINMFTFDAYLAYKPMSLLLFVAGYMAAYAQLPYQRPNIAESSVARI